MLQHLFPACFPSLGIDIRADSVRLLRLNRKKQNQYQITHAVAIPLEKNPASAKEIAQALSNAKKIANLATRSASLCLPDQAITVVDIQIQAAYSDVLIKERILETLRTSLKIATDSIQIDFQVLGVCDHAPDTLDIKVFMAETSLAYDFIAPVIEAGFIPRYLESESNILNSINTLLPEVTLSTGPLLFSSERLKALLLSDWKNWRLSIGLALKGLNT